MQRKIYSNFVSLLAEVDFSSLRFVLLCGLPGSGKSRVSELLRDQWGYRYLSSDLARVAVLCLNPGKFADTSQYLAYKETVYQYLRDESKRIIEAGKKVVMDATHLNEQRIYNLEWCRDLGLTKEEVLVVYVDGGPKEEIRKRFKNMKGKNADGRTWEEAWETAYDYFTSQIKSGSVTIPENKERGYQVIWVINR